MKKKTVMLLVAIIGIVSLVIAVSADKTVVVAKDDEVKEKEVIKWIGQTDMPVDPMFASAQRMCEAIETASGGRLRLTVEPADDPLAIFDAVHQGDKIYFAFSYSLYWTNKFPAAGLFNVRAGGMSPMAKYLWFTSGGGAELAQEMIDAYDYNVHVVPSGGYSGTPCLFLHSKYPVESVADLQGLEKVRCGGDDTAEILSQMGASVIWLPGSEIYAAMDPICTEDCIDAFTYWCPSVHWQMGFHEVAEYVYVSGCRDSHSLCQFIVNETRWNELPDDLKAIVEEVSKEEVLTSYDELCQLDIEALAKFRGYGCTVEMLSPAIEEAFLAKANSYYDEKATTEGAFYAKVLQSLRDFEEALEAIRGYDEECQEIYYWGD